MPRLRWESRSPIELSLTWTKRYRTLPGLQLRVVASALGKLLRFLRGRDADKESHMPQCRHGRAGRQFILHSPNTRHEPGLQYAGVCGLSRPRNMVHHRSRIVSYYAGLC